MRYGERCPPPCGKIRYAKKETSVFAAIKRSMAGVPMVFYHSEDCRCYHLSSESAKPGRGKLARKMRGFADEQ